MLSVNADALRIPLVETPERVVGHNRNLIDGVPVVGLKYQRFAVLDDAVGGGRHENAFMNDVGFKVLGDRIHVLQSVRQIHIVAVQNHDVFARHFAQEAVVGREFADIFFVAAELELARRNFGSITLFDKISGAVG